MSVCYVLWAQFKTLPMLKTMKLLCTDFFLLFHDLTVSFEIQRAFNCSGSENPFSAFKNSLKTFFSNKIYLHTNAKDRKTSYLDSIDNGGSLRDFEFPFSLLCFEKLAHRIHSY